VDNFHARFINGQMDTSADGTVEPTYLFFTKLNPWPYSKVSRRSKYCRTPGVTGGTSWAILVDGRLRQVALFPPHHSIFIDGGYC
jgi:hypothetical protein